MADVSVANLQDALLRRFGSRLRRYASAPDEEHGLGFTVDGICAVFSAITQDGTLPPNRFDVQVESMPPGEYLYTREVSLQELVDLIATFAGPRSDWP